jgi:ATP-dependent DNA ligase
VELGRARAGANAPRDATSGAAGTPARTFSFILLRLERVVEVRYDYMEGERFRHTAQFERWRPDRARSCTYAQLERPVRFNLAEVLTSS